VILTVYLVQFKQTLATYEELEVKRQNFLFLNFLLRGHPYTLLVGFDYTLSRIPFEQHHRLLDNPSGHHQSDLIKGNRKNVATHLCGTCPKDSPYRLLRHSKKPAELIHRYGTQYKQVHWLNRNFGRYKTSIVIRTIPMKPLSSAYPTCTTYFHRTDCLFSTSPISPSAVYVPLRDGRLRALFHL
jgi:hypothetical protein